MDNSCSEYTFVTEFFNVRGETANTLFLSIFDGALEAVMVRRWCDRRCVGTRGKGGGGRGSCVAGGR